MRTSVHLDDLASLVGQDLGPGAAIPVTQQRIDAFADCTADPQWIHVDPERAAQSPFGGTIAHGFLTLSLLSHVMEELLDVRGVAMAINYGLDRVRFPSVLRSGSRLRGSVRPTSVRPGDGFTKMTCTVTFVAEGSDVPCCVAVSLTRFVGSASAAPELGQAAP